MPEIEHARQNGWHGLVVASLVSINEVNFLAFLYCSYPSNTRILLGCLGA